MYLKTFLLCRILIGIKNGTLHILLTMDKHNLRGIIRENVSKYKLYNASKLKYINVAIITVYVFSASYLHEPAKNPYFKNY